MIITELPNDDLELSRTNYEIDRRKAKALGESQGFCFKSDVISTLLSRRDKMLGVGQYFTFNGSRQPAIRT